MHDDRRLDLTHEIKHRIITEDHPSIMKSLYRIPYSQRIELKTQIDEMLDMEVIQPSSLPWSCMW